MKRIGVAVFFGGTSSEHEISLLSAQNIIKNLDPEKYDLLKIGISKSGEFFLFEKDFCKNADDPTAIALADDGKKIFLEKIADKIEVAFPILHGGSGENGEIQGFFRILKIPFVGPDAEASAICFDKEITKIVLKNSGFPVADGEVLRRDEKYNLRKIAEKWGFPLFVKPARAGSSVGVFRVKTINELQKAVEKAFFHDSKILIEVAIVGRETECAILGNAGAIKSSEVAEIVPQKGYEFYDFDAKYTDDDGAKIIAPAKLTATERKTIQNTAKKAAAILGIEGMSRVDGFLKKNGEWIINEINTIPGFTNISMYPKLWELSGLSQGKLIDELLILAMKRDQKEKKR